jgi:hypothetical protein
MSYYDLISENIARQHIWTKPKTAVEELNEMIASIAGTLPRTRYKLHGIAHVGTYNYKPLFELYCNHGSDLDAIRYALKSHLGYGHYRYVHAHAFHSQGLYAGQFVANARSKYMGTMGGYVLDSYTNNILAISNNHVLADSNNGVVGDALIDKKDNTRFGTLVRYNELLKPPYRNLVDAAAGTVFTSHFPFNYNDVKLFPVLPKVGMRVYKDGAASGKTWGRIISVSGKISANYDELGHLNFTETVVIRPEGSKPFSIKGDSGSFIFNEHGYLVGLLFGGDSKNISFANSINNVINNVGIRF